MQWRLHADSTFNRAGKFAVKRRHDMPYGAHSLVDGLCRFRLWAPSANEVALVLGAGALGRALPMTAAGDGWWERTEAAPAGTRYRYRIDGRHDVPDPASRFNPDGVHDASEVVAADAHDWPDADWRGRPWAEAVLYELHTGTFSPAGTFAAVEARIDHLAALGVTAIELMPVAGFPGARGWGYDGVLPFAPHAAYGRPEDLKRLVAAAHARGLMVFLDVVYNHFGPEGNYLDCFARSFFSPRHRTPWGAGINFDGPGSGGVREFFIHNALYWLEEYHMDGLRLDAVHAIADESTPDIVTELAARVRAGPGAERAVHLVLENARNQSRYLPRGACGRPRCCTAQWNDDLHHALHVLLTGEADGYYAAYAEHPARHLARCLADGYAHRDEPAGHRDDAWRGEPGARLPPAAFVTFLQTHDQVGNRAFGERLCALAPEIPLRAATVAWLLAPAPPLLFMGEEFAAATPFLYFCDFGPALGAAVAAGRRREFSTFARFRDPLARALIPNPNDVDAFVRSRLDWACLECEPHARWLALYRKLLALRRAHIVPRLALPGARAGACEVLARGAVAATWRLGDGSRLGLCLNLGGEPAALADEPAGTLLHCEPDGADRAIASGRVPPHSAAVFLATGSA